MIWDTVSSWYCFCWLYRTPPSLAAKNIINLISVDHLVMSMCSNVSCDGRGYLLWPVHYFDKTLLAFALFHFVLQGQACLLLQVSLDFLLLHSSPLWWKTHLFLALALEDFLGLQRTIQLQLFQHFWLGHRFWLLWYWTVCLGNELRSIWHFWDCTQVLCLTLLLTMRVTPFLLRDSCPQ